MGWWRPKKWPSAWATVGVVDILMGLWDVVPTVAGRMSAILSIGGVVVVPYLVSFGTIFVAGTLGTAVVLWLAKWVGSRRDGGSSVAEFRALKAPLRVCRVSMVRHYKNRAGGFVGALDAVSEGAAISMDFKDLFGRLRALKVPVFEALSYRDDTPRGRRFWVAYLIELEHMAGSGDLKGARNPDIPHLIWHSGNVAAGGDAEE